MLGSALCLLPADDEALLALRGRLLESIGCRDGVTVNWRPHLTVTRERSAAHSSGLRRELAEHLPIACHLSRICVACLLGSGAAELTTLAECAET